jgi:hypothetical protein
MFNKFIKTMILVLHPNQKIFLYPQKLEVPKKENNTLMKVLCKHHGLNYFSLGYWRSIVCAHNYSMQMQYPY